MMLTCFFAACRDSYFSHVLWCSLIDCHQSRFIGPSPTGTSAKLDIVGQYDVIYTAGFNSVLSNLLLRYFLGIDFNSYVGVKHPTLSYEFSIQYLFSLPPLRVARYQRSVSKQLALVRGCDVMWFSGHSYASIESLLADWRAGNGQIADLSVEVEVPSVDMTNMDNLTLLLENDSSWSQDFCLVDLHPVDVWE